MRTLLLLFLSVITFSASAYTFTSNSNGNWNNSGTWTRTGFGFGNTTPGANDDVVVRHTVTVTANAGCRTIEMQSNANNREPRLTINNGVTLDVEAALGGGTITVTHSRQNQDCTLDVNGTLNVENGVTWTTTVTSGNTSTLDNMTIANGGIFTVGGNFSYSNNSRLTHNATINGTFEVDGSISWANAGSNGGDLNVIQATTGSIESTGSTITIANSSSADLTGTFNASTQSAGNYTFLNSGSGTSAFTLNSTGTLSTTNGDVFLRESGSNASTFIISGDINAGGADQAIDIGTDATTGGDVNLTINSSSTLSTANGEIVLATTGNGDLISSIGGTLDANGANGDITIANTGTTANTFTTNVTSTGDVNTENGTITIYTNNPNGMTFTSAGNIAANGAGSFLYIYNNNTAGTATVNLNAGSTLSTADGNIAIASYTTNNSSLTLNATNASISQGGNNTLILSSFRTNAGRFVGNFTNATLTAAGNFQSVQTGAQTDTFNLAGTSTLNVTGDALFRTTTAGSSNTFNISNSATVTCTGTLSVSTNNGSTVNFNVLNSATINANGGFLQQNDGSGEVNVTTSSSNAINTTIYQQSLNSTGNINCNLTGTGGLTASSNINLFNASTNNGIGLVNLGASSALSGDNVNFTRTGVNSSYSAIIVEGILTVTNDVNATSNEDGDGGQGLVLGSPTESGTINIGGDINFDLSEDVASAKSLNYLWLRDGTINVTGDINLNNSAGGSDPLANVILIDDAVANNKIINLNGDFNPTLASTSYSDFANSNFQLNFVANGTQTWNSNADGTVELKAVDVTNTSTTQFGSVLDDADMVGTCFVNGTLDLNGFAPTLSGTNQIHVNNGGVIYNNGNTDFMLYHPTAIQFEPAGILRFENTGTVSILNSAGSSIANVELIGTGTKTIASNIDATNQVGHIDIQNGTLDVGAGVTEISMTDAISSIHNQTVLVNANTLFDFSESVATFTGTIQAEDDSEVSYTSTSPQNIFSADYFALTLSGDADKVLIGDLETRDKLSKSGAGDVDLDAFDLTLLSNQIYDGFVGEISGTGRYVYNGAGRFLLDKRISVTTTNSSFTQDRVQFFRDLTVPIQEATLQNFATSGMRLYGVPGSGWSYSSALAYQYDESLDDTISTFDFINATNITNGLHSKNSGWKIVLGPGASTVAYTFADRGTIFQGDKTYNLTFTSNANSDNAYRSAHDGWQLIGNPYACSLDMDAVVDDAANTDFMGDQTAGSGIFGKVWVQAPYDVSNGDFAGSTQGTYIHYNAVTNVGDPQAALIPSHQAFWVKTYIPQGSGNSGNFSFTISEDHKVDNQQEIRKADKSQSPEVFDINVMLSGETVKTISFHEFTGATANYDPVFDIESFGGSVKNSQGKTGNADFLDASLNSLALRVNAIPANSKAQTMHFQVSGDEPMYQLDISDLIDYAASFSCARLTNVTTGVVTDLKSAESDLLNVSLNHGQPQIFELFTGNDVEISTYAPTCFNGEDGGIKVHLAGYAGLKNFDLVSNGSVMYSVNSNVSDLKTNLPPGEYVLIDKKNNLTCSANHQVSFTIENAPQLIANFVADSIIYAGQPTTMLNTSNEAESVEWYFADDNSYATGFNPEHTFATAGKHLVSLTAFRAGKQCSEQLNKFVQVSESTNIAHLADKNIHAFTTGKSLVIEADVDGTFTVLTLQGQVMESGAFVIGKTTHSIDLATGVYVINIEGNNGDKINQKVHIN